MQCKLIAGPDMFLGMSWVNKAILASLRLGNFFDLVLTIAAMETRATRVQAECVLIGIRLGGGGLYWC